MARDWEADFKAWSKPPTATEDDRCGNAESVVRNAIRSYVGFATRNVEVFAQGSYRNGTNVRADSDVDICLRCTDVCFSELPEGVTKADVGLVDATYTYGEFKNDVEAALNAYLGKSAVSRGNKAFDLHENSYRVDADVVPTFEHRRYRRKAGGGFDYLSGTELRPDRGGRIINWPHQNYDNGTAKNGRTGQRFKKMVRILKRLRNEMADNGVAAARPIPSYLIECLVWNVPDSTFGHDGYSDDVRASLVSLFGSTKEDAGCSEWGEVNELKYLFRTSQPWTREQANAFVVAAWNYIGFE
jgi:hypothetical protein